jgi:hypothetical protein
VEGIINVVVIKLSRKHQINYSIAGTGPSWNVPQWRGHNAKFIRVVGIVGIVDFRSIVGVVTIVNVVGIVGIVDVVSVASSFTSKTPFTLLADGGPFASLRESRVKRSGALYKLGTLLPR